MHNSVESRFSLSFLFQPQFVEQGVGVTGVEGVINAVYDNILVELSVRVHENRKGMPEVDILQVSGKAELNLNRDTSRLMIHMTRLWEFY